jgi:hypothetical protein
LPDNIVGMRAESKGMGELAGFAASAPSAALAELAEFAGLAALPELFEPNVVLELEL